MEYDKKTPIYVQLIGDVKVKILNSTYSVGEKIPSIRDYAKEMMVNPNTAQRAFRELELQGFIEGKTGMGYYVNDNKVQMDRLKEEYLNQEIDAFITKMANLNYSNTEIIEKVKEKL